MKSLSPRKGIDWLMHRPRLTPLVLALLSSVLFTLACNHRLWAYLNAQFAGPLLHHGYVMTASVVLITSLQFILLALLVNRWTAKPVLAALILATAATTYFMDKFGTYMDVPMIENILQTDFREASDLLARDMLPHLFIYAVIPLVLLWRLQVKAPPLRQSWHHRPLALLAATVIAAGSLATISRHFVPLIREHKEVRYLVTPGNYLVSLARALSARSKVITTRTVVGADARHATAIPAQGKPSLLVIVVGETVRAANWGLNGYGRQTTPELSRLGVVNFSDVRSCGTNTEISVPCMFSALGKRHYDADAITGSESLLDVLHHAGLRVLWRDNQSGCKGVCAGVEFSSAPFVPDDPLCHGTVCMDEALLSGLADEVDKTPGDLVVVLHQMGNHGPAYYQRYPADYRRFTPTCDSSDLGQCNPQQVVNSYDNALLYTDHVLARTVAFLQQQSAHRDTAMIYVSDHGESLGEHGLYLHSLPYAIAPDTQTHVPMVMWLSDDLRHRQHLAQDCLSRRARQPASHDNLFHTVLGLLDVKTSVYEPDMDLTHPCHSGHLAQGTPPAQQGVRAVTQTGSRSGRGGIHSINIQSYMNY